MSTLDVSDAAALERALDALPVGTWIVVTVPETYRLERVPGGWYLPGDVVIASGDVAEGRPSSVELLASRLDTDEEALLLLGDLDPEEADGLRAYKEARRRERGEG